MIGQTNSLITVVGDPQAQLHAPTIALSGSVITITNPPENGDFCSEFKIYKSAVYQFSVTSNTTTVDLAEHFSAKGVYLITATCADEDMKESTWSNSVIYRKTT